MADLARERLCAEAGDGVVVFLIGMRINRLWKVWRWLPPLLGMLRMLKELAARPERGLIAAHPYVGGRVLMVVQHWTSAEALHAYAHARDLSHLAAWRRFNERIGPSGDVGVWHETYVVPPGHAESIYVNMPRFGLGEVGPLFPATGDRASAAKRLALARGAAPPPA